MKALLATLLVMAATLGGGCSGINATKSVSPLDFLLPGLLQNTPQSPVVPDGTNVVASWCGGVSPHAIP